MFDIQCVNPSRSYKMGPGSVVLYVAGGISEDWAKVIFSKNCLLPSHNAYFNFFFLCLHGYVKCFVIGLLYLALCHSIA